MSDEVLLQLLASARRRVEAEAAELPERPPCLLTFRRAHDLVRHPDLWTRPEREHVAACPHCRRLVRAFEARRNPAPLPGGVPRVVLQAVSVGALTALVNWFVSGWLAGSSLAWLDWWAVMQGYIVWVGVAIAVMLAAAATAWWRLAHPARRRLVWLLSVALFGVAVGSGALYAFAGWKQRQIRGQLDLMFLGHRWIAYEPPRFNPYADRRAYPSLDDMREDLRVLHLDAEGGGGFTGLITFTGDGPLGELPRLGKEAGFDAVIMGLSIPMRDGEPVKPDLGPAIAAAAWADGYCLGHDPSPRLDFADLARWMAELRQATGRPVSTSFPIDYFLGVRGQEIREIGDWSFPDVHGTWVHGATPLEVFRETRQAVRDASGLPRDKPVLLKMISYPSAGGPGLSPETQAEFYSMVCRGDLALPPGVSLSFFAGYDLPWKHHEDHPSAWARPEEFVGLFSADRKPKPAADVVRVYSPLQRRP